MISRKKMQLAFPKLPVYFQGEPAGGLAGSHIHRFALLTDSQSYRFTNSQVYSLSLQFSAKTIMDNSVL